MNSPKILILCPDVPLPPINGPRLDAWEHVRFFKAAGWTPVVGVCRTVDEPHTDSVSIPDVITHEVGRNPRWSLLESSKTIRCVQGWIEEHQPKVMLCEGAEFAPLAAQLRLNGAKLWFRAIDFALAQSFETIRAQAWQRKLAHGAHYLGKLARIYQIERLMYHIADWVLHIGYADMIAMRRVYGAKTLSTWIPPLLERDSVEMKPDKSPLDVVYMASDYQHVMGQPAADLIAKQISPAIAKQMPEKFRFHMIGERQTKTSNGVEWHGFVDDLPTFMQRMDIACLPVAIGWGCKLKVVESLAYGLPVIGSQQTFRGLPKHESLLVCGRVEDYVSALIRLADPIERARIGEAGGTAYSLWREEGKQRLLDKLNEVYK